MKRQIACLLIAAGLFGANSAQADDTQKFKDDPAEIHGNGQANTNPPPGPLWNCFQTGLKMAAQQIAEASSNEQQYVSAVMGLGGFMTVGDEVRAACNATIDGQAALKTDASRRLNDLFVATLLSLDAKLIANCKKQTGSTWVATKTLCETREREHLNKIGL